MTLAAHARVRTHNYSTLKNEREAHTGGAGAARPSRAVALSATVLPPSSKQGAMHGHASDGLLVPLANSELDGGGGLASHDFDAIGTDRAGHGMNGTSTPGAISEHDEVPPSTPSWAMQRHPDAVALTRALEEIARAESTVDGSSVRSTTDTTPATLLALSLQDAAGIEGAEDGGGTLVSAYVHA